MLYRRCIHAGVYALYILPKRNEMRTYAALYKPNVAVTLYLSLRKAVKYTNGVPFWMGTWILEIILTLAEQM